MNKTVAVIGGGVAGLAATGALNQLGYRVLLFEKEAATGGNVRNWYKLFPSVRRATDVVNNLQSSIGSNTEIFTGTVVNSIKQINGLFRIQASGGNGCANADLDADAVLLTTGFELFDAGKKEEYGYGIFENVITSADLENMFTLYGKPVLSDGSDPKKVAFIHCVGSRDEKVNKPWCSRVCCVTAVKQAVEVRETLPDCEVYNFYMDLRMFGSGYEQLYKQAQVMGVNFIRGRLSEANETRTHRILIKAEDTLVSRPLQLTVDLVVLMAGISPSKGTVAILESLGLNVNEDGFADVANAHTGNTRTQLKGFFVAGTCSSPGNIAESVNEARAAALQIHQYLVNG